MPHLHVASFNSVTMPITSGDVAFDFIATNVIHPDEQLIATHYENKRFFLLKKENQKSILLKSDKITRPSPNYLVKHALLAYAECAALQIIDSNVDQDSKSHHLENNTALRDIHYFASNFSTQRDVQIEVGFGSGRHLLHQAKNNPETLFIGIEIHKASIEQVLKQIAIQHLDNVLVLDYDARLFLELVPSNSVSKIFVHFPVPWDKKPHRRVISSSFLDEAERVLNTNGKLELRTDSDNYFEYAYQTFIARNQIALEVHKNRDIVVSSKYEDRWKRMEKNIYDITMINHNLSAPRQSNTDFSFTSCHLDEATLLTLNGTTQRFENGFVHFERLYRIEASQGFMYRLAMGSFDRPEHLYVIIDPKGCRYFPSPPIASRSNLSAHSVLKVTING